MPESNKIYKSALDKQENEIYVGINLSNSANNGLDLLACAILIEASKYPNFLNFIDLSCSDKITNELCKIKIGFPDFLSFLDESYNFTLEDVVTLNSLNLLSNFDRLSCVGIIFGIYGMSSIKNILNSALPNETIENEILIQVYYRTYLRLIKSIDVLAIDTINKKSESDSNSDKLNLLMTKEAQLFVIKFGSINIDSDKISNEEKLIKFKLWVHFSQIFYKNLVIDIYHQINF